MSHWIFLVSILLLFAQGARAGQTSCVPVYTALNVIEDVDPAADSSFVHPLIAENAQGLFESRVRLEGTVHHSTANEKASLDMVIRFDPAFEGVSLPYNLYTVLVISNGRVLTWLDFTESCQGSGVSFFPGREIRIPALKLFGADPQKLQIMVWGRL